MPAINPGGKSAAAFRTISEVSGELDVPQHVLRFWETKFSQVRPLKRGGGRRYYRPEDIVLLRRIRDLLYRDGYTIKGVQRLLRDGLSKPTKGQDGGGEASDAERRTAMAAAAAGEARANGHSAGAGLSGEAREELSSILDELLEARASLKKVRDD